MKYDICLIFEWIFECYLQNHPQRERDHQIFAAYKVSSLDELKELLCDGNSIFLECFEIIYQHLKRTLLNHPSKEIIKVLYYASRSIIPLRTLDSNVPDECQLCNEPFTLKHLVSKEHVIKYHSVFKEDPPEISIILDPENHVYFISSNPFPKQSIDEYKYFTNQLYYKKYFQRYKKCLVHRITEAKLNLPFKDPLFIEKLLFLCGNFMRHPFIRNIFIPFSPFCASCDKDLESFSNFMNHILSEKHLLMGLTQNELNMLFHATSFIQYSAFNGYYFVQKRRHSQESSSEIVSKIYRFSCF